MIPAFVLLKRFPLWPLIGGALAFGISVWVLAKLFKKYSELLRVFIALGIGVAVGLWVVPMVTGKPHVSLLNTFAALVLPGMANGYMIFLLKGFFDSLPRELYEAADRLVAAINKQVNLRDGIPKWRIAIDDALVDVSSESSAVTMNARLSEAG